MQCRFIALSVLTLFVFSCDQDKPTAQVDSAPAHLDESLTTIEVNGAVFRRVAAKAVSTAQGGDMSIVLNYSMAGSKATIASVTIDGVRFFATGCDSRSEQGIIELDADNAITPSTDASSPTLLVLPEINGYGGAVWKHFGSYQLAAGDNHYFALDPSPKAYNQIVSLSDIGLKAHDVDYDGSVLGTEMSGQGPGGKNFQFNITSLYGAFQLFRVQGQNATTEGTYTILVQSVGNHWEDERPPSDVGNTRSRALDIPFPPVLFDDYSLSYDLRRLFT